MPSFCAVVNCGSSADRDKHLRFFRIPSIKDSSKKINKLAESRQEAWLKAIKRKDMTDLKIKYGRVCSRHFRTGQPSALSDVNHPDWAPSLNMGYCNKLGKDERAQTRVKEIDKKIQHSQENQNGNGKEHF